MGATDLCAQAGISNAVIQNQAVYVAGWPRKLRDDRKLLIHATSQAQCGADFILNRIACAELNFVARWPITPIVLRRRGRPQSHTRWRAVPAHGEDEDTPHIAAARRFIAAR